MSKLHPKTELDLERLLILKDNIREIQKEIRELENNCEHHDHAWSLEETFAFEQTPVKKCIVCGTYLDGKPTEEELYKLYPENFYCIKCDWEETECPKEEHHRRILEMVKNHPRGYNFEDIT